MLKHVVVIVGTRPEAVKLAPLVKALRLKDNIKCTLLATGQHQEMLHRTLADFGLTADIDLEVMQSNQTLASLSARLFERIDNILANLKPDIVLVQGDTTSVMVGGVCAFYRGIPVGHVEAGLRSHDMLAPFPEELNRRIVSLICKYHFAPTQAAAQNLLNEGVSGDRVYVTGNTGIDALLLAVENVRQNPPALDPAIHRFLDQYPRFVLVTGHRRENFGSGFLDICAALARLAKSFPDTGFIYPVHMNPNVQAPVFELLGKISNIELTKPLDYLQFISVMDRCHIVLTDSGGVQEEAPSLGKPVLVMRDVTERPEGVSAGCSRLVGASESRIFEEVSKLLLDDQAWNSMAQAMNPYGDGTASKMIADIVDQSE